MNLKELQYHSNLILIYDTLKLNTTIEQSLDTTIHK